MSRARCLRFRRRAPCPYKLVEAGGHLPLPVCVGVLVDQRGPLGRLPRSDRRVLGGGPGTSCKRVPGVPEVVEAEVLRQADLGPRLAPLSPEGGAAERLPLLPHEQQSVRTLLRVPVEMPPEVVSQRGRQNDEPLPAFDLVGLSARLPVVSSGAAFLTRTVRSSRSTSLRRSSTCSSGRRGPYAPRKTISRQRGPSTSASASPWSTVAMGRSAAVSSPAPRIRQGLRRINSSSTAVSRMALRSRYLLATVVSAPMRSAVQIARTARSTLVQRQTVGSTRPILCPNLCHRCRVACPSRRRQRTPHQQEAS